MADDPKLIEAVARAICAEDGSTWSELDEIGEVYFCAEARAALAAVNASGTHWVIDAETKHRLDLVMQVDVYRDLAEGTHWLAPTEVASVPMNDILQSLRAYLAKTETTK